jgi:hypothetical protein
MMKFACKYYLETNSLYHISKIDGEHLQKSFTSGLAICELISGMDPDTFQKRKRILNLTFNSDITIDWRLPEEIIFESFSAGEDFEFVDERTDKLQEACSLALELASYEEFKAEAGDLSGYFSSLETRWRTPFINATVAGQKILRQSFIENPNESIFFNGQTYPLNSPEQIKFFLTDQVAVNRAVTINGLVQMLFTSPEIISAGFTEQEIFDSYNGWMDHYVDAFSINAMERVLNKQIPAQNDFVDLMHLLYLRNFNTCKIVSDDKIFSACEHLRIKSSALVKYAPTNSSTSRSDIP